MQQPGTHTLTSLGQQQPHGGATQSVVWIGGGAQVQHLLPQASAEAIEVAITVAATTTAASQEKRIISISPLKKQTAPTSLVAVLELSILPQVYYNRCQMQIAQKRAFSAESLIPHPPAKRQGSALRAHGIALRTWIGKQTQD